MGVTLSSFSGNFFARAASASGASAPQGFCPGASVARSPVGAVVEL